jgi:hypothetical protein
MSGLKERFPIYSKFIRLYPLGYQKEYGQQILQTTADMLDNAKSDRQKLLIWSKVVADTPKNITKQQLQLVGGTYMKETPNYVKISGILTGLLLIPFFLALIANGLDKVINNHTLYNSWIWRYDYIRIWVLILPMIAVLVAIISLLYFIIHSPAKNPSKRWRLVYDLKHNWPIVATGLVALGILFMFRFHDSVPCLLQIPRHFLSHRNQGQVCRNFPSIFNGPAPAAPSR